MLKPSPSLAAPLGLLPLRQEFGHPEPDSWVISALPYERLPLWTMRLDPLSAPERGSDMCCFVTDDLAEQSDVLLPGQEWMEADELPFGIADSE